MKPLQHTAYRYNRDISDSATRGYQEHLHLLLDGQFDETVDDHARPIEFHKLDGTPAAFPDDLPGMSGCSVWRVGDLSVSLDKWSTEKARLVAVQTGVYNRTQAIKATRWIAVSTLIHEAFPELRPAMGLLFPH